MFQNIAIRLDPLKLDIIALLMEIHSTIVFPVFSNHKAENSLVLKELTADAARMLNVLKEDQFLLVPFNHVSLFPVSLYHLYYLFKARINI